MFPKMNPKQMKKMMRQMGMEMKELPAKEVLIRLEDSEITISGPNVSVIEMQGQKTYQISGGVESAGSSSGEAVSDDDVAPCCLSGRGFKGGCSRGLEECRWRYRSRHHVAFKVVFVYA